MIPRTFPVNELSEDLFPDQLDAIWSTHAHIAEGAKRILGVACTGWGKTRWVTNLAKGLGARTLFLAHRRELIDQAAGAFAHQWPGVSVGRIDQKHHQADAHVTVAMVQTLVGRLDRTPGPYDLIVVDEPSQRGRAERTRSMESRRVVPRMRANRPARRRGAALPGALVERGRRA